ncbi:MAG: hypothetical protein KBB01_04525 [Candidatus Omnitrophica bacterium]|jgi:signal transduction histidine kinase|nr:hypothetical protein [Candidatus Omnitrophota bacterium]
MEESGKRYFGTRMPSRFRIVKVILILIVIFSLINAYALLKMFAEKELFSKSDLTYFTFLFIFITAGLSLIAVLAFILYYSFGALSRIEKTLEKIVKGERVTRISLRKKDLIFPLAERINKVIKLLEQNTIALNKDKKENTL